MVSTLTPPSALNRIRTELISIISDNRTAVDIIHTPELDFTATSFVAPRTYQVPCYNITLEVQPETRGVPFVDMRANFNIFVSSTGAASATEDDAKTMIVRDAIHTLLNKQINLMRLQVREMQRISDSPTIPRGNGLVAKMQLEFKALKRRGEY